jgi:hypothetical protein
MADNSEPAAQADNSEPAAQAENSAPITAPLSKEEQEKNRDRSITIDFDKKIQELEVSPNFCRLMVPFRRVFHQKKKKKNSPKKISPKKISPLLIIYLFFT